MINVDDIVIVYQLLCEKLPDYKFELEEVKDGDKPESIWAESEVLFTHMILDGDRLLIADDCRKHLDCDERLQCEPDYFVVELARPDATDRVDAILNELEIRRIGILTLSKDPFALFDRDMRIKELETLLKKHKIRIPKS